MVFSNVTYARPLVITQWIIWLTENQDKNGSVKGTCQDDVEVKEIKVEPNSNPKLPGNKKVEPNKKKLKAPPVPLRMLRCGSKK